MPPRTPELLLAESDDVTRRTNFARTGSALRAASKRNPRNLPCPTCKRPDQLTPADVALGYQCDGCADIEEGAY